MGLAVGSPVGAVLGARLGAVLGSDVLGAVVGADEGVVDGTCVGADVGCVDGAPKTHTHTHESCAQSYNNVISKVFQDKRTTPKSSWKIHISNKTQSHSYQLERMYTRSL